MSDVSAAYASLLTRIEEKLEAMPLYAREFVLSYRRHIELIGRAGPLGCADVEVERFIDATNALLQAQWDAVLRNTKPGPDVSQGGGH